MSEIINDLIIGELEKTNNHNRYEGKWDFVLGHTVNIIVYLSSNKTPELFHVFLESVKTKDLEFRQMAAQNLLKLYNETWSEDDTAISETEFAERIKINSISFDEEKDYVSVYYDDADLFAGHEIKVDVSFDGTVLKADLP
jgi:hypothetical protein